MTRIAFRSARPLRASRARAPRESAPSPPGASGRRSPRSSAHPRPARHVRRPRAARIVGETRKDRRDPDADVDPRIGEPPDRFEPACGRCRSWLGRPPDALVERGEREEDLGPGSRRRLLQNVDVTHHERPAGDDREGRPRGVELDEARAREAEPALGGLVRIRRRSESHLVSLPRRARELASQNLGDVQLHANRAAIPVVRGAVGTLLEVADVRGQGQKTDGPPGRAIGGEPLVDCYGCKLWMSNAVSCGSGRPPSMPACIRGIRMPSRNASQLSFDS